MSALTQMALANILKRRLRKYGMGHSPTSQRVQALIPHPPAVLCDIYRRDVLSFLYHEKLIECRQMSADLNQQICAWQVRGRLPNRTVVGLELQEVGLLE